MIRSRFFKITYTRELLVKATSCSVLDSKPSEHILLDSSSLFSHQETLQNL